MAKDGLLQFSDIEGKLDWLHVACDRCGRAGRYKVVRLIFEFGRDAPIHDFVGTLDAACPNKNHQFVTDRCRTTCPGLAQAILGDGPRVHDERETARKAWWGPR